MTIETYQSEKCYQLRIDKAESMKNFRLSYYSCPLLACPSTVPYRYQQQHLGTDGPLSQDDAVYYCGYRRIGEKVVVVSLGNAWATRLVGSNDPKKRHADHGQQSLCLWRHIYIRQSNEKRKNYGIFPSHNCY